MIDLNYMKAQAANLGFCINQYELEQFDKFANFLVETNKNVNLTAITAPEEIVVKHFLDSLLLLRTVSPTTGAALIDVGTGGGFPGVPVKILRPDMHVTLLDSLNKRIKYLVELSALLGQNNVCVHSRAEDAGKNKLYREKFDIATARAVASLKVLCEYCLPLVKVGGVFCAMKGHECEDELDDAFAAIKKLGGELGEVKKFELPDGSRRSIIVVNKISQTSTVYPRNSAKIEKNPL